MKELIMGFVGIFIAIIIVSSVAIPMVMTPIAYHEEDSVAGVVVGQNINSTNLTQFKYTNFTVTHVYTGSAGVLAITSDAPTKALNVTTPDDNSLVGTLTGTSPYTVSVSAANMAKSCSATQCKFNYTSVSVIVIGYNVTAGTLKYAQTTTAVQDGWDAGTSAIWGILGIALVAILLLMVFSKKY